MKLRLVLLALLLLSICSGCKKSGKLYLVPIGDAPVAEINDLATHYQQKFGMQTEILPAIKPDETDIDAQRRQLIAENLVQSMLRAYSDYRMNDADVLIGITAEDIYPRSQDWEFCFGWRDTDQKAAVASTARMGLHYLGEPAEDANLRTRLRKVVTKDIGILYYAKPPNENPRSVLYSNILEIQELDQVTENF